MKDESIFTVSLFLLSAFVCSPCFTEFFNDLRRSHRLIRWIYIRQTTHVTRALDVVMSTQWVDAATGFAHIAEQHLQIGEIHHIAHADDVLSNAHCPYN